MWKNTVEKRPAGERKSPPARMMMFAETIRMISGISRRAHIITASYGCAWSHDLAGAWSVLSQSSLVP